MPAVIKPRRETEPPRKRLKLEVSSAQSFKFTDGKDISRKLSSKNHNDLANALTALRNRLTIKNDEEHVSPQDERLLLVKEWLEQDTGARQLFEIWEEGNQISLTSLVVSVLSCLLTLLSSQYMYHALGYPIVKTLLSARWTQRLNAYLGGSHTELILVTLKLFNALVQFSGGRERKAVIEVIAWETKSLPKLLYMRRKGKEDVRNDGLLKPDIRTLYILLILAFIDPSTSSPVKATFLEQHRNTFMSIFKGLAQDSYSVVRKVLELCWTGVLSDPKLKRTVKINLFNETTLSHILKLYDREVPEGTDTGQIPADLAHHFLLAVCTRPGTGVCFKDRGWYPRESDEEDKSHARESSGHKGSRIYNKILLNILKVLKVNEDPRQQELALKILSACPELVAVYWPLAALTLEPRLSSKWIANISFFGSVISLPIPTAAFLLPNSSLYSPSPPPLGTILENILPSVNVKTHLSKGLQSSSALVQHCTALALSKCLLKYDNVLRTFESVEKSLEENIDDGQWSRRRKEVEREVRRRVPDFQVIVAMSQQKNHNDAASAKQSGIQVVLANPTKVAMLSESAHRLLWLYHRCLPSLIAEARFDVGKLLHNFLDVSPQSTAPLNEEDNSYAESRFHILRRLHILRLLNESEQFAWASKIDSSHTHIYTLLKTYVNTEIAAVRTAIDSLLRRILSESIMFQEDPDEIRLWLVSLPTTRRAEGAEASDGTPLMDEGTSVISFVDDCVQRCMKTPYRYLEEMDHLVSSRDPVPISPLLMTVIEQLHVKVDAKLLSPSDVVAISTFLRKLCFNLAGKQQDLRFLCAVANKIDASLAVDRLFQQNPSITKAVRREVAILQTCLRRLQTGSVTQVPVDTSPPVQEFLKQVEGLPVPSSRYSRQTSAFALVDWLRLEGCLLHPSEVARFVAIIKTYHPPALKDFFESLDPNTGLLWDDMDFDSWISEAPAELIFGWLFIQCTEHHLAQPSCRLVLMKSACLGNFPDLKRALCLIFQRINASDDEADFKADCLTLAAFVVETAVVKISADDLMNLKHYIFVDFQIIKELCRSRSLPSSVQHGLQRLVEVTLDPKDEVDRELVADFIGYWSQELQSDLSKDKVVSSLPWIRYMHLEILLAILDKAIETAREQHSDDSFSGFLGRILGTLEQLAISGDVNVSLRERLPQLATLQLSMPSVMSLKERVIVSGIEAFIPIGYDAQSRLAGLDVARVFVPSQCDARWGRRLQQLPEEISILSFLDRPSRTLSGEKIIKDLLYQHSSARKEFQAFLLSGLFEVSSSDNLIVLDAFFDTALCHNDNLADKSNQIWIPLFTNLLYNVPLSVCGTSVLCMLLLLPHIRSELLGLLQNHIQSISNDLMPPELFLVGTRVVLLLTVEAGDLCAHLVDRGLRWCVRYCSSDEAQTEDSRKIFKDLSILVKRTSTIKAHLVEPVLVAAIQNRLSDTIVLRFLIDLVQATHFKPMITNRYLQSILQHPQFLRLCAIRPEAHEASCRDDIIHFLYVLFYSHPTNTCQPSHIEPLIRIYGGSLSLSDRRILSIFQLFERTRKNSVSSVIVRWSSVHDMVSSGGLEALCSVDASRAFRTCLLFPHGRGADAEDINETHTGYDYAYDPMFLTLLFSRMLLEDPPSSALVWVQLLRTNIVSLLIRGLSSKAAEARRRSLFQISALRKCLESTDMQEKPQVIYVLNMLKNLVPYPSDEVVIIRLPSYATLVLAHAFRGIFYPSNFIYPHTARFLLQRPELDVNDVPMLYGMLYSSSDEWRKERTWIVRFLSHGLQNSEDWKVFTRRHTWDLLAGLFQSSDKDRAFRDGVLDVLANATCIRQAVTSLVVKSALLAWVELQLLQTVREEEGVVWVRLLENVVVRVDHQKVDSFTNREWRSALCRCLFSLVDQTPFSQSLLISMVSVILRISLLPGPPVSGLPSLVEKVFGWVKRLETTAQISSTWRYPYSTLPLPLPPHRGHTLHIIHERDQVLVWGESVESLWRVSMSFEEKWPAWDGLTSRLLVWRSFVGEEISPMGEWARREVAQNMSV